MLYTISRTSDQFMDCVHPNPNWRPHEKAEWSNKYGNWVVDIRSLDDILSFISKDVKAIITKNENNAHLEIDDISGF
jgi:hypothetical protein